MANKSDKPVVRDSKKTTTQRPHKFSTANIAEADGNIVKAFAICGLISKEETLICPVCGTSKHKKVELRKSVETEKPYWTCHKCPEAFGGAIDLLMEYGQPKRSFKDAVEELLGRKVGPQGVVQVPDIAISDAFAADVDVEIYDAIRDGGSLEAAQKYYSRWHISPETVAEAGATLIEDADQLQKHLTETYGLARLKACGVITEDSKGKLVFLFNKDYPVIEVHQAPSGHVVGLQFRPSGDRMAAVTSHKAWKKRWSGQKAADGTEIEPDEAWRLAYEKDQSVGRKAYYVTPFLSLKGGTPDHLVGCGLKRLIEIPKLSTVYIVEGFKDLLAARTMGVEAYAIPGTGIMPPERSIEILRLHKVVVMLDGDKAGQICRDKLVTYLTERGVNASPFLQVRENMDVTDILVERTSHTGCICETCTLWRTEHPFDPATCPCKTCKAKR